MSSYCAYTLKLICECFKLHFLVSDNSYGLVKVMCNLLFYCFYFGKNTTRNTQKLTS